MNGKHPIDDHFARVLREAEATPPDAVWKNVAGAMDRPPARAYRYRRITIALLLLLLLGGAAYWSVTSRGTRPDGPGTRQVRSTPPTAAPQAERSVEVGEHAQAEPSSTGRSQELGTVATPGSASDNKVSPVARERNTDADPSVPNRTHERPVGDGGGTERDGRQASVGAVLNSSIEGGSRTDQPEHTGTAGLENEEGPAPEAASPVTEQPTPLFHAGGLSGSSSTAESALPRSTPDVHLPRLASNPTPVVIRTAPTTGALMRGDSTPAYLLRKGRWWFALQGGIAKLDGHWSGSDPAARELNRDETWLGGRSLGLVVGREWLNGWSAGLGIGAAWQRARFLRLERTPGPTETVIDTTWTNSFQGPNAYWTWNIVETDVTEPGTQREFRATNEYLWLRVAPEAARQLFEYRRLSLHARAGAAALFGITRKGSTLYRPSVHTLDAPPDGHVNVVDLNDAAVRERFAFSFALWGALELQYRVREHWSVGALPMVEWRPAMHSSKGPALSMTSFGGALRLRYDLFHQEKRTR